MQSVANFKKHPITLILGLLVTFTLLHWLAVTGLKALVHQRLAEWKNGPTMLADLERRLSPGPDNAAVYYRAAESMCGSPTPERFAQDMGAIESVNSPGGYAGHGYIVGASQHPEAARRLVEGYGPAYELLQRGSEQSQCVYSNSYHLGFRGAWSGSDQVVERVRLSRLVAIRLSLALHENNRKEFNQAAIPAIRWLRRADVHSGFVGLMARIACTSNVLSPIEAADPALLSPELRDELRLFKQEFAQAWEPAFETERLATVQLYSELLDRQATLREVLGAIPDPLTEIAYSVGGQPLLLLDELDYLNRVRNNSEGKSPFTISSRFSRNTAPAHKQFDTTVARLVNLDQSK